MPNILVSAKAIIPNRERFLILQQSRPGLFYWDLPGGKLTYGESPEDAVIREIKEETCIAITVEKLLGIWWFFSPLNKHQIICITYLCRPLNRTVDISQNPADESIKDFKWVTKKEFLEGDYPILHESLKEIIEKI